MPASAKRRSADPGDLLADLSDIDAATVVRCARVLLRHPLLRPGGPEADLLPLVYRHRVALQELFAGLLGYRLVVERRFARLHKAGPGRDAGRGEPSLSPRGYAYLALAMAALTGVGRQVLLSRLVADIRSAATEAGLEIGDDLVDRRALTAALRHLVALGAISETDGTVSGESSHEALITVDTDVIGQLLAGPLGQADSADELIELAHAPSQLAAEHAVRRRLVEDPVVLHADLPAEQADWLLRRHRRESQLLERYLGLVTETRAEGVAVTDPEEYLSDVNFPGTSTVARIALLALPELLAEQDFDRDSDVGDTRPDGRVPATRDALASVAARLVEEYPTAWSRQATEDLPGLVEDILALLGKAGLVRLDGEDTFLISPAAHRWLPEPDDTPARPAPSIVEEPGWSLFGEETA